MVKAYSIILLLVLFVACSNGSAATIESTRTTPSIEATVEARIPKKVVIVEPTVVASPTPSPTPSPTVVPIDVDIKLKNFLIKNLGPYDSKVSKFGDIKFDARFSHLVFSEFGRVHIKGQSGEYHNPTFEFKAPSDTKIISPIKGVISFIDWQSSESVSVIDIKPPLESDWIV